MQNGKHLFDFLKLSCTEIILGVNEKVLNDFLHQHRLALQPDHHEFILEYGNSDELLLGYFLNCTYAKFENVYSRFNEALAGDLPDGTVYFGADWSSETLCIESLTGSIFIYNDMEKDLLEYESINAFLFYCFLNALWARKKFEEVHQNIKIEDVEKFFLENEQYYLQGLDRSHYKYYLNGNMIVELNCIGGIATLSRGGILDSLIIK